MSNRERIEQTERRLADIEALQLKLDQTQQAIVSYRKSLVQKLGLLRQGNAATNKVQAAPTRDRFPVAKPVAPPPATAKPSSAAAPTAVAAPETAPVAVAASAAQPPGNDRRASPRRKGNPVPVQINTPANESFQGWVLDRSQGGLRI